MNKNERRNNALQESRSVSENLTFMERLRGLRLDFSLDGESILKGIVCAVLLVFFCLLQTTLFTNFRPLGAVPDLVLPLVIAISMTEKERWGAIIGLIGAIVIESLGGSTFTVLPILYTFAGNFDYALLPRFGSDARTLHPRFDCGESIFHAHRPLRNDRKRDIT